MSPRTSTIQKDGEKIKEELLRGLTPIEQAQMYLEYGMAYIRCMNTLREDERNFLSQITSSLISLNAKEKRADNKLRKLS